MGAPTREYIELFLTKSYTYAWYFERFSDVSVVSLSFELLSMFDNLLPKMGIEVRFVDGTDPKSFVTKVDDKTRAFFTESCSNPSLDIFDIEEIANEAHAVGLPLIVLDLFHSLPVQAIGIRCRYFDEFLHQMDRRAWNRFGRHHC